MALVGHTPRGPVAVIQQTGAGEAARRKDIPFAHEKLIAAINDHEKLIEALEARLQPLSRPLPPTTEKPRPDAVEAKAPIAEELERIATKLNCLSRRLDYLLDALEI